MCSTLACALVSLATSAGDFSFAVLAMAHEYVVSQSEFLPHCAWWIDFGKPISCMSKCLTQSGFNLDAHIISPLFLGSRQSHTDDAPSLKLYPLREVHVVTP